jgi:hypothetical protein
MAVPRETPSEDNVDATSEKEARFSQEVDLEKAALRLEKAALRPDLERQLSEPPWSVFSKGMKIWIIFLVSISALISPFGASMFLPALNVLSDVLDISPTQVNISITTYMVCLMSLYSSSWKRVV